MPLTADRPHRILLFNSSADLFGSERALVDLGTGLQALGHEILVVLPEDGPAVETFRASGLKVDVCTGIPLLRRSHDLLALAQAARGAVRPSQELLDLARSFGPTLVYSNTSHSLAGPAIARAAGAPHVWHVREIERVRPAARRAWGRALLATGPVVAISHAVARGLCSPATLRRQLDRRLHVVHDGIDLEPFVWRPLRQRGDEPAVISLPGRITPWKGQDVAARAVSGSAVPAVLEITGATTTEEDAAWCSEVVAPLARGAACIRLCDPSDTPADIYRRADFLLQASIGQEPFGRTVIEAMASGVIPIVPDQGGPAEVVRDTVDGFVYRHGDLRAMRAAIELAVTTAPSVLAAMSRRGRQRVVDCFTAERNAAEVSSRVLAQLGKGRRS